MNNYDSDWDFQDSMQPEPETPDYMFDTEAMYEDY